MCFPSSRAGELRALGNVRLRTAGLALPKTRGGRSRGRANSSQSQAQNEVRYDSKSAIRRGDQKQRVVDVGRMEELRSSCPSWHGDVKAQPLHNDVRAMQGVVGV